MNKLLKKCNIRNWFLISAICICCLLMAVHPENAGGTELSLTKCVMVKGETCIIAVRKCKSSIRVFSDHKTIASVKKERSGKYRIIAKKAGKTCIRFKTGRKTLKCRIIVKDTLNPVKLAVLDSHSCDAGNAKAALSRLGARISIIQTKECDPDDYDGLVIPGGTDIDPARYGEMVSGSVGIDKALDRLQFDVTDRFIKAGKPVFGICRGCQLLNVYFGGTLKQNIAGHRGRWHSTVIMEESNLQNLYGTKMNVFSSHHQAIRKIGRGLIITQRAGDNQVEAVEHESLPVFAVQWHPEHMGTVGEKILKRFISICRKKRDFL